MLTKNLLSILYSAACGFLLTVLFNLLPALHSHTAWYSVIYYATTCFVLNLIYAANSKSKSFSDLLFAGIIIRLLLALIVILVYAVLFKADFAHFAIHFICHYILFTVFEIRYLVQLIKNNSAKRS